MKNIDYGKLPEEFRNKLAALEKEEPAHKSLTYLSDMADILQELLFVVDENKKETGKNLTQLGAIFVDAREQLQALNGKENPDHASPVVAAVKELGAQLVKELSQIEVKPEVTVQAAAAPKVSVAAPEVTVAAPDLSKLEKLVKTDLPKAFTAAVAAFPITDNGAVLEALQTMTEWLESIDHAARMKPSFPNTMAVTGTVDTSSPIYQTRIEEASATVTYIGKATPGTATSAGTWQIQKIDTTSGTVITWANAGAFTAEWDNRLTETYS